MSRSGTIPTRKQNISPMWFLRIRMQRDTLRTFGVVCLRTFSMANSSIYNFLITHLLTNMITCFQSNIIGKRAKFGHRTQVGKQKKKWRKKGPINWKQHYEIAPPRHGGISSCRVEVPHNRGVRDRGALRMSFHPCAQLCEGTGLRCGPRYKNRTTCLFQTINSLSILLLDSQLS